MNTIKEPWAYARDGSVLVEKQVVASEGKRKSRKEGIGIRAWGIAGFLSPTSTITISDVTTLH